MNNFSEYIFIIWNNDDQIETHTHYSTEEDMKLRYNDYCNKAAQAYFWKKDRIPTAICVITRINKKAVIIEQEEFSWKQ